MNKRILMMTSVEAEQQAVLRGLHDSENIDVFIAGVGIAQAATRTAVALARKQYDLVINAGIGGGFVDRAEVGSLVVASDIICADLGAESAEGFIGIDKLGFGTNHYEAEPMIVDKISKAFQQVKLPVNVGTVLTVSTVTGTKHTADELVKRFPNAYVEAMEGFGVATAAREFDVPFVEIRSISNAVGPRDRESWRIKEALQMLESASSVLKEVL